MGEIFTIIRLAMQWLFGWNSAEVKKAEEFIEQVEGHNKASPGSVELHDSYERQQRANEEEAWRRQKAREEAAKKPPQA
jgi:hypothetical protein